MEASEAESFRSGEGIVDRCRRVEGLLVEGPTVGLLLVLLLVG